MCLCWCDLCAIPDHEEDFRPNNSHNFCIAAFCEYLVLPLMASLWFFTIGPFLSVYIIFKRGTLRDSLVLCSTWSPKNKWVFTLVGLVWFFLILGVYLGTGYALGSKEAPVASVVVVFAISVVGVLLPLVVRLFSEGKGGLLRQRY
jgi:hypothetical protein